MHRRALLIGGKTTEAIDIILASRYFPQQSYKACQGVFALASRYGEKRMEATCGHILSQTATINYTMIKNVLEKNLDKAAIDASGEETTVTLAGDEVRGADEYTNRIMESLSE
jgi:hypothetical protein